MFTFPASLLVIALVILFSGDTAEGRKSPPVNGYRAPSEMKINHPFNAKKHREINKADQRPTVIIKPSTPASTPVTPRTQVRPNVPSSGKQTVKFYDKGLL